MRYACSPTILIGTAKSESGLDIALHAEEDLGPTSKT